MRVNSVLKTSIVMLALSLLSVKCDDDTPVMVEGDVDAPVLSIVNPDEGDLFYTENGMDTPDYVIIEANASDASTIIRGSATVYNSANEEVYYYEETSATQNGTSITTIYTSFRTSDPGEYDIVFEFEDANGNSNSLVVKVTCLPSDIGDTDLPS